MDQCPAGPPAARGEAAPASPGMAELPPQPELMRSLGRLVRGLSALFWGLPLTLVVCVWTASPHWIKSFGLIPPLAGTGLLVFGLAQLASFQRQERVWRHTLDRTRLLALANFGLSPFLYWWSIVPANRFFFAMVMLLALGGLLFLASLNQVLRRLSAMLPDEGLRLETRQFTTLNFNLLAATLLLAAAYVALGHIQKLPLWLGVVAAVMQRSGLWLVVLLVLMPLAMTMALLWKTKEVILDNVFGAKE